MMAARVGCAGCFRAATGGWVTAHVPPLFFSRA